MAEQAGQEDGGAEVSEREKDVQEKERSNRIIAKRQIIKIETSRQNETTYKSERKYFHMNFSNTLVQERKKKTV